MESSGTSGSVATRVALVSVARERETGKPPSLRLNWQRWTQPVVIPAALVELPRSRRRRCAFEDETFEIQFASKQPAIPAEPPHFLPFLHRLSLPGSSRSGIECGDGPGGCGRVVFGGSVVGHAGAWEDGVRKGRSHENGISRTIGNRAVSASGGCSVSRVSDNLMNPAKLDSDAAPLTAVPEDKLAALPKITGVRHWSSSMGSTVVIDMEDQVPYEVHRLMSPERIYFDLHDTVLSPELDGKTMDVGDASLTRVRIAQPVAGVTRIVLDTKDGSNFSVSMETSPYRLVVELRGSEKTLAANQIRSESRDCEIDVCSADAAPAPAKAAPVAALAAKASDQPSLAQRRPANFASCSTPGTAAGTWARLAGRDCWKKIWCST